MEVWLRRRYNSFFFLGLLFIWVNFLYINEFLNGLKPERVSDFLINSFWNCKESEGRVTKSQEFWKLFSFLNFQTFGNLEIDFGSA